jgi:GTP-binding protein HflX
METMQKLKADNKPAIIVFNKIDRLKDLTEARRLVAEWPNSVAISAATGAGISDLLAALVKQVKEMLSFVRALVPYSESGLVQDCYDYGRVHKVDYRDDGIYVEADLVAEMRQKLSRYAVEE